MMKHYDSSSLKCFMECPRKYFLRYIQDFVPKIKASPLNFGTAIHEGIRVWYLTGDEKKAINMFHDIWIERVNENYRTHEKGEDLLKGYFKKYANPDYEFVSPPEQPFKIDIEGKPYVGRFDRVIRKHGRIYVLDHKTASRMGQNYYKRFRPDIQMYGYTKAARELYEGYVAGAMIDVLYFTKTKMEYFQQPIAYEDWELDEFKNIVLAKIKDIESRDPEDINDWEMHTNSCTRWGSCLYYDVCTSENPMKTAEFQFIRETWNPLENKDLKKEVDNFKKQPTLHLSL